MTSTEKGLNENSILSEAREEIIKTAVKFLQNPHVSKSPLAQSQKFLRSKGLTDQEIQIACERSGAYSVNYFNEKPPSLPLALPSYQLYSSSQQTLFMRVRDTLQSVAVFSGLIYAVYLFYKKFIRPWLFGEKKKKSIADSISELNKSVSECMSEIRVDLNRLKELQTDSETDTRTVTRSQLQDLKNEITSVKGLLLSRKQFPSVPPSIPAWQLSSVEVSLEGEGAVVGEGKGVEGDDEGEEGSGSGYSENEHGHTKNSDSSSLEIM